MEIFFFAGGKIVAQKFSSRRPRRSSSLRRPRRRRRRRHCGTHHSNESVPSSAFMRRGQLSSDDPGGPTIGNRGSHHTAVESATGMLLHRCLSSCLPLPLGEKAGADPSTCHAAAREIPRMYPGVPTPSPSPSPSRAADIHTYAPRAHAHARTDSPTFRPPVHAAGWLAGWLADRKSSSRPFGVTDAPLQPFAILYRGGDTLPRDVELCDNPKRSSPNSPSGARGN